jgi:hypothetical protein
VTSHHWIFFFLTFSPRQNRNYIWEREEEHGREEKNTDPCQDEVTTLFRGRNYQISKGICRSKQTGTIWKNTISP